MKMNVESVIESFSNANYRCVQIKICYGEDVNESLFGKCFFFFFLLFLLLPIPLHWNLVLDLI